MKPIIFEGCAGWLHPAPGNTRVGVVLCNPYGHELLWSHRGIRTLAETIAAAGIPALRFDYRGTGDSLGAEDDGDMVQQWLESIESAVAFFKASTGVERIVLCGLRMGGALASMAAKRIKSVDGIVMMAPVLSGKDYLRELQMVQKRWKNTLGSDFPNPPESSAIGQGIETFGFRLSLETQESILAIDLAQDLPPAGIKTLICDPDKRPYARMLEMMKGMAANGDSPERVAFPDYTTVVCEEFPTRAYCPTLGVIAEWINREFPAQGVVTGKGQASYRAARLHTYRDNVFDAGAGSETELYGDGFIETPVLLDNGRLFGVYCVPANDAQRSNGTATATATATNWFSQRGTNERSQNASSASAVIFPNTATNHHIGDARMWVIQARRLARQGVASLRMDVSGLGDGTNSVQRRTTPELHTCNGGEDVSKAVDWMYQRGHRRISLAGVCSGAYLSLHAALLNPRATGLILVNQRVFAWEESRHAPGGVSVMPTASYLNSLRRLDKWKRLLTGQSHLATIVTVMFKRAAEKLQHRLTMLQNPDDALHPAGAPVRAMIGALARRGVRTHMVYGSHDTGMAESETYFGPKFSWLKQYRNVTVSVEPLLDHALFLYPGREFVMTKVCEHFQRDTSRVFGSFETAGRGLEATAG